MMFSAYPLSTRPFSSSGQQSWAFFESVVGLDISFQFVIYVASAMFATRPDDVLANQMFRGTLKNYTLTRSIMGQRLGEFVPAAGKLAISNEDAYYDFLPQFYSFDARPVTIKATRRGGSFDDAFPLGTLTATATTVDLNEVAIDITDYGYLLDVPMQPNLYGGTGGADGGADLTGKRIPLSFGPCLNVSPPQISSSLLIYQVHGGAIHAVTGVFDRGVALSFGADRASYAALAAATVAAGHYDTCLAAGLIRLGSTASGLVTVDVEGENAAGYLTKTADIVRWALLNRTTLTSANLDAGSFTAVNAAQPATVSYWIGPDDSIQVSDFVANLMGGIGGWGGHNRAGFYEVRIFAAPAGDPVQRYSRLDILGPDEPKRGPLPAAYTPPSWRWRVPFARVWTVQRDLAAGVTADRKAMVAQQFRLASAENTAVKVDHPTAQDPDPVQAFFADEAAAAAEAQRRLDLFKASRRLYTVTLPRRAFRLDVGRVVNLTFRRFDLAFGKLMTVVAIAESVDLSGAGRLDEVMVTLYG